MFNSYRQCIVTYHRFIIYGGLFMKLFDSTFLIFEHISTNINRSKKFQMSLNWFGPIKTRLGKNRFEPVKMGANQLKQV